MLAVRAAVDAAEVLAEQVLGASWATRSQLLEAALEAMASSNKPDLVDIVPAALGGLVEADGRRRLRLDEGSFTRQLGLAGRRTRGLSDYLGAVGCGADGVLSVEAQALVTLESSIAGIAVEVIQACTTAMAGAPVLPVETAIAELNRDGIDGERVCWGVISVESRRHVPLVLKEANRAARSWPDRGADGLIGYAWQGLRLGLRNYDPSRGMFSTYACPRIRGSIRDGIRSESHLPKRLTTFVHKVERTREALCHTLGRHPSLSEVAEALDMDLDRIGGVGRLGAPISLNELAERNDAILGESDDDPESNALDADRRQAVELALAQLEPGDALAVRLLVLESVSVAESQARTGMSARQLRSRRDRGLEQLSGLLTEWAPVA